MYTQCVWYKMRKRKPTQTSLPKQKLSLKKLWETMTAVTGGKQNSLAGRQKKDYSLCMTFKPRTMSIHYLLVYAWNPITLE